MKPTVIQLPSVPYRNNKASQLCNKYGFNLLTYINDRTYAFKNLHECHNFLDLFK